MDTRSSAGPSRAAACLLALLVALAVVPLTAGPAHASGASAEGTVPADVRAAFEGGALRRGITTPETDALAEVRAGTVHQVFTYTRGFLEGGTGAPPVEAQQEWVAGVEGDGAPRGWLRVWKQDGGPATPTGWQPDPAEGEAMLASTASGLVSVPWDGTFFSLVDGVVSPVVVEAGDAGAGPRSLAEVQQAFAAERTADQGCGGDACAGGGRGGASAGGGLLQGANHVLLAVVAVLGVGAVGGVLVLLGRPRPDRRRTGQAPTRRTPA